MSKIGREAIDQSIRDAFARHEYLKEDGTRDWPKLRACIFEAVVRHKVLAKGERLEKAIAKSDLVSQVFPELPVPEDVGTIASEVYQYIASVVWGETKPSADGSVQRMLAQTLGNGYVMCRAQLGKDRLWFVYVTDDPICVELDFIRPANTKLARMVESTTSDREMLMMRQPQNAERYARGYRATLKAAEKTASERLQLTLGALDATGHVEHEDSSEEETE